MGQPQATFGLENFLHLDLTMAFVKSLSSGDCVPQLREGVRSPLGEMGDREAEQ